LQPDATKGNPLESLPTQPPDQAPLLSADATECTPATDAGLTPAEAGANQALARLPGDRLLTVSEAANYLGISKFDIYEAPEAVVGPGHVAPREFGDAFAVTCRVKVLRGLVRDPGWRPAREHELVGRTFPALVCLVDLANTHA
jgi:hypothetical protein